MFRVSTGMFRVRFTLFGHKHDLIAFYFTEKSIPCFTNSNCFIIRTTQSLVFLYTSGRTRGGFFLERGGQSPAIAKLFMCQFPGSASETFPLTVGPPAANNGARTHAHVRALHSDADSLPQSHPSEVWLLFIWWNSPPHMFL